MCAVLARAEDKLTGPKRQDHEGLEVPAAHRPSLLRKQWRSMHVLIYNLGIGIGRENLDDDMAVRTVVFESRGTAAMDE